MAYRDRTTDDNNGPEGEFRLIEMIMTKKSRVKSVPIKAVMTISNQVDTIRYVQSNMADFVANCVRVKTMETYSRKKVEESASLFEHNLEPFFSVVSATDPKNILDKLSSSLKKALILMAMEKYQSNTDSVCQALGITREKLEREIAQCGLSPKKRAA